jgi:heptosyltransferase-2
MSIPFYRWIDRIFGTLLILPLWLFSLPFPKARLEPRRILVIKLWAMGESILTLPLIHAIKKKYPKATVTVLARDRVRAVYTGNKDISEVKSSEFFPLLALLPRLRRYDLAIDCEPYLNISALLAWWLGRRRIGFSHGVRSLLYTDKVVYNDQQHITLTYLDMARPLGFAPAQPERLIPIATSRADEKSADQLFKEWGIKKGDKLVCISPGAAESSRGRIWPAKRFAKVADALVKEYLAKIIITGSKGERRLAEDIAKAMHYNVIIAAGETSVKDLAALLKRCTLMVGNDSGPMHLSAAMGTKTLGLFCPNTPVRWAPYGPGNDFVYKPIMPRPCVNTHLGQLPDCKDHKHMSLIMSSDVLEKARRMLARTR